MGGFPPWICCEEHQDLPGGTGLHTLPSCLKLGSVWNCLELGFGLELLTRITHGGVFVHRQLQDKNIDIIINRHKI